jgi:hypothetical protein
MDGTVDHDVKQNKPDLETQIWCFLSHAESRLVHAGPSSNMVGGLNFCYFYFLLNKIIRFCSTGVWTKGTELARQALYHLSRTPGFYAFWYFSNRFSHFCLGCPGPWPSYLCFPCSWDSRHVPLLPAFLLIEMGSWELFYRGWPPTTILPISASWVVRIICVSHHTQLLSFLF